MSRTFKVAVVDDFRITRQYFESYVQQAEGYELVMSLANASDAVVYCLDSPPDLLILDILMKSGVDGLSASETLKKWVPEVKIILATSTAEANWEDMAKSIGVEGFWYKEYSKQSLLEVMDRVMAGEVVYPEALPDLPFGRISKAELTERELDVLRELTGGFSNEGIAQRLGISNNTVRYHIQNILNKTGFTSRLDLAMNARVLGLVISDKDRLLQPPKGG